MALIAIARCAKLPDYEESIRRAGGEPWVVESGTDEPGADASPLRRRLDRHRPQAQCRPERIRLHRDRREEDVAGQFALDLRDERHERRDAGLP